MTVKDSSFIKNNEYLCGKFLKKMSNTTTIAGNLTGIIADGIAKAQKGEIFFKEIYANPDLQTGKNEFLFFIKPEITLPSDTIKLTPVLELIQDKIQEFGLKIHNIKVLSAEYLDKYNVIAQHYGVINKIATNAIKNMSETAKDKFKEIYGIPVTEVKVLGGIEFLQQYPSFNALSLDFLCQNKKSAKLAGGTYVIDVKLDTETVYVVNGFHARQLLQFTDKGRSIVVMTLSGDLSWADARTNFIGATFPDNAAGTSIRKNLLLNKEALGIPEISQGLNGVHLSAGPVEALIELKRYNSDFSDNAKIKDYSSFSFGKKLIDAFGGKSDTIVTNPDVNNNGKMVSVFDITEEKNSDEAIEILKKYF